MIGIPGKSPGEVGLLWQERKLLIVGNAVIANPPGQCGLLPEKVIDDPVQLEQSLQAVLVLDFDTLLMGDGSSIVSHGKGAEGVGGWLPRLASAPASVCSIHKM